MLTESYTWPQLGAVAPTELASARQELHYAAQTVSGVGRTFLEKRADDSHTALKWVPERGALASLAIPGSRLVTAELQFSSLTLQLLVKDSVVDELPLLGRTTEAADRWIADSIAAATPRAESQTLEPRHYELPPHPLNDGASFDGDLMPAHAELGRWFDGAATALEVIRNGEPNSSPVTCWPHHFDIATLIDLGDGKSIGVGLSPGDASYDQPYFYVGPYPAPEHFPVGPSGHWHTNGYSAVVLTGDEIASYKEPEVQRGFVVAFLESAIAISKELLDESQ